jgi:DNA-binding NtrC family response regulator
LVSNPIKSILLVEDDDAVRQILARGLHLAGYEVAGAANGRDAIAQLDRRAFDLVITDLLMPGVDGLELLQDLLKRQPRPAVIAMSGGGKFVHAEQGLDLAMKLGASAPLVKPFTMQQLLETVKNLSRSREAAP